jgi:hypothetical protein
MRFGVRSVLVKIAVIASLVFQIGTLASANGTTSSSTQPAIDPKAVSLLKGMSDFLGTQNDMTVHIESLTQVVYPSGMRLLTDRSVDVAAVRPNMLRVEMASVGRNVVIYYNGQTATLYTPAQNVYASFQAPGTIADFVNAAQNKYDLRIPAMDVFRRDAYTTLMKGVKSAQYIGQALVRETTTNHLIFRRQDIDYELWIKDGDEPLPIRLVITDKTKTGAPMFAATYTNWNLSPVFPDNYFTFVPPADSHKIGFLGSLSKPVGAGPSKK